MQSSTLVLSCLLLFAVSQHAVAVRKRSAVTPVGKVIQLLAKLQAQVSEGGAKEAAEYDKYACFCKSQARQKAHSIKKSEGTIAELAASIEALDASIAELNTEITTLGEDISGLEQKITDEMEERATEHEKYLKVDKNHTEGIEAIQGAIEALQVSKGELKDANLNLAQVVSPAQLHKVTALIGYAAAQNPSKYSYSSNDIIATLQKLLVDFRASKKDADEAEYDSMSTSESRTLGFQNEKKFKEKAKKQKELIVGAKTEDMKQKQQDKDAEEAAVKADEAFSGVLTKQCEDKAAQFDQRSKARSGELTAMSEALEILKTGVESKYSANKKLVDLAQKKTVSLVQLSSDSRSGAAVKAVLAHLLGEASKLKSPVLSVLAAKVGLQDDHFVKVRGLINDLISRMKEQKKEEASAKSMCDRLMGEAVGARDKQSLAIEEHTATISLKQAEKAELLEEITVLTKEIAELHKALNEATELRSAEKAANEKTVADATAGKAAVGDAITVLQSFYDSALLQSTSRYTPPNADREGKTVGDLAPEMSASGDYKGQAEASGGIIGLLQVIQSDFERTETTVAEEEKTAQAKFEEFKSATESSIEAKMGEKAEKESSVTDAEDSIVTAQDNAVDAKRLHKGALDELDKLRPMCVDGESYAERTKKRQQEIDALKEALRILEEWKI